MQSKHYLKPDNKAGKFSPYEQIALASVEKAIRDWIELMTHNDKYWPEWLSRKMYPTKADAIADIERFMLSEDWKMYTDLDGKKILDKLYSMYDSGELKTPEMMFRRVS